MILAPRPLTCVFYPGDWDSIPKDADGRLVPGSMFFLRFGDLALGTSQCHTHEPPCTQHLMVVCPDGHWWDIDSRCSNCTKKDDKVHHCWVRHGEPPHITVDKKGVTCNAGAGSIQTPDWHGYLRKGELVD